MDNTDFFERRRLLAEKVRTAWKNVPKPEGEVADSGCPEDVDVTKLFKNKTADEIDLDSDEYQETYPMIYMSVDAKKYFIQTYFYYCLDVKTDHEDRRCTPCGHIISELTGKSEIKHNPNYTADQIDCIIEFLELVGDNLEFFGEENYIECHRKAIRKWQRLRK
mgnify:CR=1 FL=1